MQQWIEEDFVKMGARVNVSVVPRERTVRAWNGGNRRVAVNSPIKVDIRRDDIGEFYSILVRRDIHIRVAELRRSDRHLLLIARENAWLENDENQRKFLCGHDERAWFVAAIPESTPVSTVQDAKDALKPQAVWESIRAHGVPMRHRDHRTTAAFVRQGEWFFIPRPEAPIESKRVVRNEPIRRGAGKPHMCQFLHRSGGEQVYVSPRYPNGLTIAEYGTLEPHRRQRERWTMMVREAQVYARGAVSHADHATIWLKDWHQVVMNTETQAKAMRHVAFLD